MAGSRKQAHKVSAVRYCIITLTLVYTCICQFNATRQQQRYKAKLEGVFQSDAIGPAYRGSSLSHRLPPLAEDIVDEFGHGLGAAGASPALLGFAALAGVLHHLGEYECHLLVVLGR